LCVDTCYVENLIALVSTCSCPTDSKYQSTIVDFFVKNFKLFFKFNETGCVIIPYEVYPQAALVLMWNVCNYYT